MPGAKSTHEITDTLSEPKINALREWMIYSIIFTSLIILLCGRLIYLALISDLTGICILILVLFVCALVRNALDVSYIDQQRSLAHQQVKDLIKTNKITAAFLKTAEPSILRDHLLNLSTIAKKDPMVSQDNLVVLMQSKLNARLRLTELASSMLVTLGLVGTIVGLIGSVGGISVVVEAVGSDRDQLMSGMRETLGGMGTAFYTTLLGALFGGIVLRILSSVVNSHADSLIAYIAELAEVYMVPTLRRSSRKRTKGDTVDLEVPEVAT